MATPKKPGKRIVIACDGTWLNSDDGFKRDSWFPWNTRGHLETPSNVTRICRSLLPVDEHGTPQLIYYHTGVGSENNLLSFLAGGYLGRGFSENVREAYAFICNNYVDGDEIYLLGFSRGAFTARSIGSLISSVGILTMKGLADFYPIFKDWANQENSKYVNSLPTQYFVSTEVRPKINDGKRTYVSLLQKMGLTRLSSEGYIPIKAIGVWDTVGALGVPDVTFLPAHKKHDFSFIDTEVSPNVENAFQALALDERRKPFSPTVWGRFNPSTPTALRQLKQTWFPGVHSNIGNSYPDAQMGDLTLSWMADNLAPLGLAFDTRYLEEEFARNTAWVRDAAVKAAPEGLCLANYGWALGKVYSSDSIADVLAGREQRTPGQYVWTDPATGLPDKTRALVGTDEHIHPCVRVRRAMHGLGKDNAPAYNPDSLIGWRVYAPGERYEGPAGAVPWKAEDDGRYKYVLEDGLGGKAHCILEDVIAEESISGRELSRWPDAKRHAGKAVVRYS